MKTVGRQVLDSQQLEIHYATVADSWPEYLELLSLWQLKRYFTRVQNTVRCKPRAVVVTVHPTPHFKVAKEHSQWIDACKWVLLGYCNHGHGCPTTFKDYDELMSFTEDRVEELAERFINTKDAARLASKFATCPPHVRRDWQLGMARKQRAKERQHSPETVIKSLSQVKFVFDEPADACAVASWSHKLHSEMTPEEQDAAKLRWFQAEEEEESAETQSESLEGQAIRKRMKRFVTARLKWTHRELHDVLISVGFDIPVRPSLLGYFSTIRSQFGDTQVGFLPQSRHSHSKARIQGVLKILGRTGVKLGGKMSDAKNVMADRLAHWLNKVVAAGQERDATDNADSGAETCDSEKEEEQMGGGASKRQVLVPRTQAIGEVPFDALVNPEQAESALGHTMSTEFDDDLLEMIDLDQRAEEEALLDRQVNPRHVDYSFLCWSPQDPQDISPSVVGWPSDMQPRQLQRQDFTCQKEEIQKKLKHGVTQLYTAFERQLATPEAGEALEAKVLSLDPTQLEAYKFVTEWAERQALTAQPHPLRLLMLGTAGTGKTHAAKSFITKVEQNTFYPYTLSRWVVSMDDLSCPFLVWLFLLKIEFLISSKTKSGGSFTDWLPGVPAAGLRESQQVACGSSSGWLSSGWLMGVPAAGLREFQRLASGMIGAALDCGRLPLAAGIALAFHCFLRTGEMFALHCGDVQVGVKGCAIILQHPKGHAIYCQH